MYADVVFLWCWCFRAVNAVRWTQLYRSSVLRVSRHRLVFISSQWHHCQRAGHCTNFHRLCHRSASLLLTASTESQNVSEQAVWPPGSADTVCPRPPLTLTFDHLTLKLLCESHLRWRTFLPNLGTLGLWVLELFAMYATDGQTDGRTDKSNAYLPYGRGRNKRDVARYFIVISELHCTSHHFSVKF